MSRPPRELRVLAALAGALALALVASFGLEPSGARAEGLAWRLEQPAPPEGGSAVPLGRVGDIEFYAPNLGLLITTGNGKAIEPGVWAYTGAGWHELATVCGASDGRIAWASADEFWTISDGRPGQAANARGELPNLVDDTLCHFQSGAVSESFATLAFEADSYEHMDAAGCIDPSDCWFGGENLPEDFPPGAFHLHWNGSTVSEEPDDEEHAVIDMRPFAGHLYESVKLLRNEREPLEEEEIGPSSLHRIEPEEDLAANGGSPFAALLDEELQLDGPGIAFEALRLGTGEEVLHAGTGAEARRAELWAAAGPSSEFEETASEPPVTVLRASAERPTEGGSGWTEPVWEALAGSETGNDPLPPTGYSQDTFVSAIAPEPGNGEADSGGAWVALDTRTDAEHPAPTTRALLAHISAAGAVSEVQEVPAEGAARGAAARLVCPASHDCWMVTTQGWLYHLAPEGERQLPEYQEWPFSHLITTRPPDASTPEVPPLSLPIDDSGLLGEVTPPPPSFTETKKPASTDRVAVPLLSSIRSRLVHGSTLELRFHLAVLARVQLVALRGKRKVASTPTRTFRAGSRKLLLRLDPKSWPTKLDLRTHALAPLPTISESSASVDTVSTSETFRNALGISGWGPEF
jgi:hypothetical protein